MSLQTVVDYLHAELGVDEGTSTHVHVRAEKCIICARLRKALALAEDAPESWPEPAPIPPDYWETAE